MEKRDHAFFGAGFQYCVASVAIIREKPLHGRMEFESANAELARAGLAFVRIHRGEGNQYVVVFGAKLSYLFVGIASKACLVFRIDWKNHSGDIALSIVGRCFLHCRQHSFGTRRVLEISRHAGLELAVPFIAAIIAGLFGVGVEIDGSDLGKIDHERRLANAIQGKPLYGRTVIQYNKRRLEIRDIAMADGSNSGSVIRLEIEDGIATLAFNRPEKRNAINEALVSALDDFFSNPPEDVTAVILTGSGGHFCAGLDLAEHESRGPVENVYHSREWHRVTEQIEFGGLPVISVLVGAVIGGGLEIAASTHVRIAEPSVRFQMPEGRRGIFVGGGATVRVGNLLGADRMREMMLTGRVYDAENGAALGLAHYAVDEGQGMPLAREIAQKISDNAQFSNFLIIQAIPRINDMSRGEGLFTESLAAAMSQATDEAKEGLRAFLEKRPPKFR